MQISNIKMQNDKLKLKNFQIWAGDATTSHRHTFWNSHFISPESASENNISVLINDYGYHEGYIILDFTMSF